MAILISTLGYHKWTAEESEGIGNQDAHTRNYLRLDIGDGLEVQKWGDWPALNSIAEIAS